MQNMIRLPVALVKLRYVRRADSAGGKRHPLEVLLTNSLLPLEQCNFTDEALENAVATFTLLHDLARKGWSGSLSRLDETSVQVILSAPQGEQSKREIQHSMEPRRLGLIRDSADWIRRTEKKIRPLLADGLAIDPHKIDPVIELCETQLQRDIFRYCRYLSSVPYSEYVGRRLKFLVRDASLPTNPIIGIAAIGSSLLQITSRDKWIGWHQIKKREVKTERIGNVMDLYVCVSIPPYSYLLGGKLVCYMMVSNWIRQVFAERYGDRKTLAKQRVVKDLVMLITTSIYGENSSQYNRIRFNNMPLYIPVGETEGYGTLHISDTTFEALKKVVMRKDSYRGNKFGDGANWRLRVIRDGMKALGFNADECLNHGHPRGVFVIPLARNAQAYLSGKTQDIDYFDFPLDSLIKYWRDRWLNMRIQNPAVMQKVYDFRAEELYLSEFLDGE